VSRWLYVEMLKAGYTSVCGFHYVHHAQDGRRHAHPAELAQRVVDAASETGIGMTMLPAPHQYSGFGAQPLRAVLEDSLRAALQGSMRYRPARRYTST
jgi:formimidoylglutamate deiminase